MDFVERESAYRRKRGCSIPLPYGTILSKLSKTTSTPFGSPLKIQFGVRLTMAPRVVDPPFPPPPPLRRSCGYLLCSPWTRKNPLPLRSNLVPCQGRYSRRIESGRSARGVPLVRSPRRGVAAFITQPKYSPTFCASPLPSPLVKTLTR